MTLPVQRRDKEESSRRAQAVAGGLGIVLSVAVFVAQGPYDQWWKYALVATPLFMALAIVRARPLVQRFQRYRRALIHAKEAFYWVTGTEITSTFTVRVQNAEGDLLYERFFRVAVLRNGAVEYKTKQDLVGAEVLIPDFPPKATILSSRPAGVVLAARDVATMQTMRGGHPHFDYRWAYSITPALRNRGDFVEYSYASLIPKCEAKAFTEAGSLFFFLHESIPLDVEYSLIAPARYKIHIVEAWIEDPDKARIDLPDTDRPELAMGDQVMTWHPSYRKGHAYLCRYRLNAVDSEVRGMSHARQRPNVR